MMGWREGGKWRKEGGDGGREGGVMVDDNSVLWIVGKANATGNTMDGGWWGMWVVGCVCVCMGGVVSSLRQWSKVVP